MTFGIAAVRIAFGNPPAAVPDHDGAAAVFALGYRSLERVVLDRMILDLHSKALLAGIETWTARHRPALHHTVEFEPQIVVQPARGMLLYHIAIALAAPLTPTRLWSDAEFSFLAIDFEGHVASAPQACDLKRIGIFRRHLMPICGAKALNPLLLGNILHGLGVYWRTMSASQRLGTDGAEADFVAAGPGPNRCQAPGDQ